MASRNYGDMPLGSQPLLPQYTYSRAGQRARPKTQTFTVSAQGAVCAEPPVDEKAFDSRAHIVDRAEAMRRQPAASREATFLAKTARAMEAVGATSSGSGGLGTTTSMMGGTAGMSGSGATTSAAAAAAAANGGMRSRMALVTTTTRLPGGEAAAASAAAAVAGGEDAGGGSDLPPAVLAEKQVLRFYAWFREAVPESRMETNRLRKVTIQFYVETGDISVFEPRTHNSGLPQGPVVGKGRIVKREREDGSREFMDWREFSVADEVTIYGRTYRIYDADGFTRDWFARRGLALAAAEAVPEDVFFGHASEEAKAAEIPGRFRKRLYDEKIFQEARLGKPITDARARARFMENDGKLLRFDCLWHDAREGGDMIHYVLQWHLADDKAELLEVHHRNDGRDPTRVAVSKRRMPRDWHKIMVMPGDTSAEAPENWMEPTDIVVGSTVNVFGRDLLIRGADGFTRDWFRGTHGVVQPPAVYSREEEETIPTLPPPPHMGIGDPDDTIQSTKTFAPKPPKRDFEKWSRYEGVTYRFKARFVMPPGVSAASRHAEGDRFFTIALYPTDDTLGVFEPPRRNSGQSAGKFLARAKHRHETGRLFRVTDFRPGHTVIINTRLFRIDDADPFTRREEPEVDLPVPEDGKDNMFPRGPSTTSHDGTMMAVPVDAAAAV